MSGNRPLRYVSGQKKERGTQLVTTIRGIASYSYDAFSLKADAVVPLRVSMNLQCVSHEHRGCLVHRRLSSRNGFGKRRLK